MKTAGLLFLGAVLFSGVVSVSAQSLEPRLYSNTPTGLNFLLGGFVYSTGGAIADPSIDLKNGDIEFHSPFLAYARSFGLWDKSAKFDVVVPYGFASGSGTLNGMAETREVDGFADPQFRVSMNFIGAPALSLAEFKNYKQNWVVGTSLKITAPLGQYDSDKLLNIGMNRWAFKPELGVSKTFGRVIFELAGAITLYTDNKDYLSGQKREQAPLYSTQGHLIYLFKNKVWVALDATHYAGGRTTIDEVEQEGMLQNSRLGATLAIPINKNHSLKLYGSSGISTRYGTNFDTYGVAWQYRWGGGL
jgi:hypothetical protein